jgi:hypothetical protein
VEINYAVYRWSHEGRRSDLSQTSDPIIHEHVRALAVAVRDDELTPEQREHLVDLLHSVGSAVGLARGDHYPG